LARDVDIVQRTFAFAVNIVKLANELTRKSSSARILPGQILRAGTSVGANVEEAQAAGSRADFIHKYSIALKEARETRYWLRLLRASNTVSKEDVDSSGAESDEICRIIAQIVINARKKQKWD
jgi:four helix bundle protein